MTNTLPRLTKITTTETATAEIVAAFTHHPHCQATEGRSSYPVTYASGSTVEWDPLSTEGTHRASWVLTGCRFVGQSPKGNRAYVLRFAVNGTSTTTFAAYTLGGTLWRSDYDGGCMRREAEDVAERITRDIDVPR